MAFLLGCEKVSVDFPTKTVFEALSLGVDAGARIGIVGRNGDGKSTLLSLLAGALAPDTGRVIRTNGVSIGLLGQQDELADDDSVHHAIVGDLPEYEWASSPRIRSIIDGLAGDVPWEGRVGDLSGGQRRRVDLARVLVGAWDVLMLDEPTNHLDMRAIAWLTDHLKRRWREGQGALLVVTHDRWFLDEVCLSMWEVRNRGIEPFEGGFSAYIMQRVERERLARVSEQRRQNKLRRELAWLSRGARARSTKPKFHVKAAQELIADVPELRRGIELKRMAIARLGNDCIDLENVAVAYGARAVLDQVTWIIGPGDRVGIVGANGAGKTTLLNAIQRKVPLASGRVKIGKTVRFGVLTQSLEGLCGLERDRVRQVAGRYSSRVMLGGEELSPADLLERLGFSKADLNEPVGDLSGGQRRRLALMLVLLDQPNVLVLDEPGNDLDVDMLAAVEDLLDEWPGTLVLVTHDRYLMERVTDDQFALMDGVLRHLPGGVDEYLKLERARRSCSEASESANDAIPSALHVGAGSRAVRAKGTVSSPKEAKARNRGDGCVGADDLQADQCDGRSLSEPGRLDNGEDADFGSPAVLPNSERHALKKELSSTERRIRSLTLQVDEARAALHALDPTDFVALGDAQEKLDALAIDLDSLEERWLDIADILGEA